ncbi:MAG: PorV/PorQ family protein [Ignavibacteriales bacterium]|nr:PorV/PorQ family protein [Ignavibacteriales bacterium]
MKKIRLYTIPLIAIMVFSSIAFSQKVGSTSMQFLKVMPCARATAMGDAYGVLASGAEAVFWNPAGVARVQNNELSMTYLKWIFDTQQAAFSYATTIESFGAVGVQFQYVDFGEIQEAIWSPTYTDRSNPDHVDYPGLTGRTFRPFSYLLGVTYANQITDKFSTGLSVKYAHESLYNGEVAATVVDQNHDGVPEEIKVNTWANGIIFDFGLDYSTGFRTVRIGASMQNFGANVKYASETNPVPMALRVGVAADVIGEGALLVSSDENRLGVAFDFFQPNDYAQQMHLGAEYEYAHLLAVRAGYKFNYDADGLTVGAGIQQQLGDMRFFFDYSFATLNYNLGNVHRISLGVRF